MAEITTSRDKAPMLSGDALLLAGVVAVLGIALIYSFRTVPSAEQTAVRKLYRAHRERTRGQQSSGHGRQEDCDLVENSSENLDRKLDHALEETFPTSDPVSVKITK
jgi:hypothetical protein